MRNVGPGVKGKTAKDAAQNRWSGCPNLVHHERVYGERSEQSAAQPGMN